MGGNGPSIHQTRAAAQWPTCTPAESSRWPQYTHAMPPLSPPCAALRHIHSPAVGPGCTHRAAVQVHHPRPPAEVAEHRSTCDRLWSGCFTHNQSGGS
eukprot:2529181-Rhodomonas_salina.3